MRLAIVVGHSARHKGAAAVDGTREYDFTRPLAARITDAAMVAGHEPRVFLRDGGFRAMIEEINAWGPGLIVSLHFNAMPASHAGQAHGTEVLHYPGSTAGRAWAEKLAAAVSEAQGTRNRGAKAQAQASEGRGALLILRDTRAPAVIVELFFGDNAGDYDRGRRARDSGATARAVASALG